MGKNARILKLLVILLLAVSPAQTQEPIIENISWSPIGELTVTHLEVTFTIAHPSGQSCWIALWGHDTATRAHFPMQQFVEGSIENIQFPPGTHTVTWDARANAASRQSDAFQVFLRVSDRGRIAAGSYLVIDVTGGSTADNYPVDYVDNIDATRDEYKTDKIVLRELPSGGYASLYPITQQQYQRVTDESPAYFSGNPMRPVEQVSWSMITGAGGYENGFIAALREKTALTALDLPESNYWEYASRAGVVSCYNDYTLNNGLGTDDVASLEYLGWYENNSGGYTRDVGGKQPNAWGLYDAHGNVWEWTRTASDTYRATCGGGWDSNAGGCCASFLINMMPDSTTGFLGFRLFLPAEADIKEAASTASIAYHGSAKTEHPSFVQASSPAAILERISDTEDPCDPELLAPVINLNGPAEMTIECGSTFLDPSATVIDTCEGDITHMLVIGGDTVNTTVPNTYVLTYNATNSTGNHAVEVTRIVHVVDGALPSLRLYGRATMDHSCNMPFSEPGAYAFDMCDGDLTSAIFLTGAVDETTPGQYTLQYSVADSAGNISVVYRQVFVLDNCLPSDPPADDLDACLQACLEDGSDLDEDGDGLTACEEACYGTSDLLVDTDGDGMPDFWEIVHGLDPLRNDAHEDRDGDNLTNIEEYLLGSDPNAPNCPRRTYFVATDGVDIAAGGTADAPFRSIAFALEQASPVSLADPAAIIVSQGYYREGTLNLPRYVSVESRLDAIVIIEARINGAEGASLSHLELRPFPGANYLLFVEGLGMNLTGVVFEGMEQPVTGAILVPQGMGIAQPEKLHFECLFDGCLFTGLDIGIDAYAEPPVLRRNVFENIVKHALVLRPYPKTIFTKALGDANNPETGFNTFLYSIDGAAVVNERDYEIKIENNDWDTDDPNEIAARIEGPADFDPFLQKGAGMTAAALFCSVVHGQTQQPITNAAVVLGNQTITRNERGVYAFPAIASGSYILTVTAPDSQSSTQNVKINESAFMSLTVPLRPLAAAEGEPAEGEPAEGEAAEGEEEPPPDARCRCGGADNAKHALFDMDAVLLSGLAVLILLAWPGTPGWRRTHGNNRS